jgi:hypothetical protein
MNKLHSAAIALSVAAITLAGCSSEPQNKTEEVKTDSTKSLISAYIDSTMKGSSQFLTVSLLAMNQPFKVPAIQSYASATYNNFWILVGGQKYGFHGTSNNPAPFRASVANDSIWVIDFMNGRSWGAPVPAAYQQWLMSSNPAYYQLGNMLYFAGGYTRSSASAPRYDMTSDRFLGISLPNLISYVQSGGASPSPSTVIPINIQSPYVQVTGGELFFSNNYFYLIGGQNYNTVYSSGQTGIYTNSIRRFSVDASRTIITDTLSFYDPVNLHRRDLNVVPTVVNGQLGATIYGGVFTKNDMAFRNPVYVTGWQTGNLTITPDAAQLDFNQYSCAVVPMWMNIQYPTYLAFLGGISYQIYDPKTQQIVTGDHGMPMPFSNLISIVSTDGMTSSTEAAQIPPTQPLMPGYLGSNAQFFPLPAYVADNYQGVIDLNKVFPGQPTTAVPVGYMIGGILSMGPTSGTTPSGHVDTYPNPVLYQVLIGPAP